MKISWIENPNSENML
jgi:hypothetical protein